MDEKPIAAGKSSFDLIDQVKVFRLLDVGPDDSFLDLACGVGRYSIPLAQQLSGGGVLFALDLWEDGLKALEAAAEALGLRNIKAMTADMTARLPLKDASIDGCLVATVLHDLSQDGRRAALREISRVLRPGGDLWVIEFKKIAEGPGPPLTIRLEEHEVESEASKEGFDVVVVGEAGPFHYFMKFRNADTIGGRE